MPVFKPDPQTYVMVGLEHAIPGIIDFSSGSEKWVASLLGGKEDVNWYTIQSEIKFWEWVEENYPGLQERVSAKTTGLKEQLENYPRSGFIGISSVYTKLEPIQELKAWSSSMEFLQGLLLWLFLINLGVGAFNLLPIRALDGGRMWEILLQRFTGKKRARRIINNVSTLLVFLIILNFFVMLKPF